jgi:hypothetical protein
MLETEEREAARALGTLEVAFITLANRAAVNTRGC